MEATAWMGRCCSEKKRCTKPQYCVTAFAYEPLGKTTSVTAHRRFQRWTGRRKRLATDRNQLLGRWKRPVSSLMHSSHDCMHDFQLIKRWSVQTYPLEQLPHPFLSTHLYRTRDSGLWNTVSPSPETDSTWGGYQAIVRHTSPYLILSKWSTYDTGRKKWTLRSFFQQCLFHFFSPFKRTPTLQLSFSWEI